MPRLKWIAIILGLTMALALPSHASASKELRDGIARIAKEILANTKDQPVSVGQFTPTNLPASNAGVGLEQLLRLELEALHRGIVQANAVYEVKGDYTLVSSETTPGLKEIKILARLIQTESGDELVRLRSQIRLTGTSTIAELIQLTASLPPSGTKEQRNKEIQQRLRNPLVFVHGPNQTLISSGQGSPYAVELLVKPLRDAAREATPRSAHIENGQAFVEIQKDELYEVRVYNNSGRPVAVALTVDGLDVFHFSQDRKPDGRPRFTHFIVSPKGSQDNPDGTYEIVGWHHTVDPRASDNYLSFLVTEYGKGAVSRAGVASRGQVGVIHVQFAECSPLTEGAHPRGGTETGFGPPRKVTQTAVRYQVEPPHDFVSIRYNR